MSIYKAQLKKKRGGHCGPPLHWVMSYVALSHIFDVTRHHGRDLRTLSGALRRSKVVADAVVSTVLDGPEHRILRIIADLIRVGKARRAADRRRTGKAVEHCRDLLAGNVSGRIRAVGNAVLHGPFGALVIPVHTAVGILARKSCKHRGDHRCGE